MLLNQGIRTKVLTVLALPIVALMIVAGVVSMQAFGQASKAERVEELAQGSGSLGGLVASLQAERSASIAFLDKRPAADELAKARKRTDAALASVQALLGSVDLASLSPQATDALVQSTRGHDQIPALRLGVTKGNAQPSLVGEQYSAIIGSDINLPRRIGEGLTDRAIGSQLTAYSSAQQLVELATQERDTGVMVITAGTLEPATSVALGRVVALQTEAASTYRRSGTSAENAALDTALSDPAPQRNTYRLAQQELLGLGGKVATNSSTWRNVTNDRISALQSLTRPIAIEAGTQASDAAASARNRALAVLAVGLLVIALMVLLGSVLSRTITRPLRRLTEVAAQVRDELPLMVERMATPGEGPGVTLPEIPTGSRDEVGQLARAFQDVNDTTIRVAEEQAALRASIAEMFVNVARRNHVLLSRQLSFIDQLERTEENPDTLENLFRLDHLATRMRRNAESLIVLAGIDAGRRLRRPMPLADVLRTAVSEIERYDRVDLALQTDPPLVGHVALSAAHLLAELLENATQFSNPDTRVIASTALTSRGVRVTITDLGLGMTWDEIGDANERIANPPMRDVVGSQRLGFYVVGRLARRLDATVALKPGRSQGTVVTIDLPPGLFVPGTVAEVAGGLDEPLEADVEAHVVGEDAESAGSAPAVAAAETPARSSTVPVPREDAVDEGFADNTPAPTLSGASPAPVAEPARSGIFGGVRARRGTADEKAVAAPQLPVVEDSTTTFVPVLEPSAPAPGGLPQRSEAALPTRGARSAVAPTAEPPSSEPAPAAEPVVVLEPQAEPVFVPQLEPVAVEVPQAGPQTAPLAMAQAPLQPPTRPGSERPEQSEPELAAVPEPTPTYAPRPELDAVPGPIPAAALSKAPGATSALHELATEPTSAPVEQPAPAEQPLLPAPPRGLPAMDILPAKSAGGRSWLRRSPKQTAGLPASTRAANRAAAQPVPTPLRTEHAAAASSSGGWGERPSEHGVTAGPAARHSADSAAAPSAGTDGIPVDGPQDGPIPAPPSLFTAGPPQGSAPSAGAALPTRSAPAAGTQPAEPQQAVPALAAAQSLRERSAMASEALSELSALSTYRPEKVQAAPANLAKRTPQATPAGQLPTPEPPSANRRPTRNAADVRSMLSGFQAGVERGRTSPAASSSTEDGG